MDYNNHKHYLLMQVNDSVFPIGGYTQSYGLETYILQNRVKTKEEVLEYLSKNLTFSLAHTELLATSLSYDHAMAGNLDGILAVDEILSVSKTPCEIREASHKLGGRFVKTVLTTQVAFERSIFNDYSQKVASRAHTANHAVAYGAFCASIGAQKEDALSFFLYSSASAMVTNAVKTIPLSQTQGQQILYGLSQLFDGILEQVSHLTENDLCPALPGLDIACMQHECLYSRLYMS